MNIAVYCGTSVGNDPVYQECAKELGLWMAGNGHSLIFGGGNIGLMGVVAKHVFENSGRVIGVLPSNIDFITARPQPYCSEIITEADLAARKQKMLELADAYIALPGGIGTLDEITEVMTLIKIDKIKKPAVLYDIHGFYSPFKQTIQKIIQCGFMVDQDLKRILFSDNLEDIEAFLLSFQ
ncbi:MAG: TIGR00730 family Rossman fold protein [Clostridia bacterium]|nr:TIGR00730 family Rossman fold protein [Clostridia bacterium]